MLVNIRKARLDDVKYFSAFVLASAPFLPVIFGSNTKFLLEYLFCIPSNLFSFEHVYFAEITQERVGMILSYDWNTKKKEGFKTGLLVLKKVGPSILSNFLTMLKLNSTIGKIYQGDYYVSNVAVYPDYRGKGIGKDLLLKVEDQAKISGSLRMVLDVEKYNTSAFRLYEKLGYVNIGEFVIYLKGGNVLNFVRMVKEI